MPDAMIYTHAILFPCKVYVADTFHVAAGDSCMKRWETGPYAKGPPMYMRDPFNHEHHVSPASSWNYRQ